MHSDQGANFTSTIIAELCFPFGNPEVKDNSILPLRAMGKWKRMHQTLIRMIGKLPDQKKVNWPVHLPEVVQAYNGTQSAIMGYSPHYLMFGLRPRFPIDLYFPTLREKQKNSVLIIMLLTSRSACNKHWKYLRNITKMKPCDKSYFDCLTGNSSLTTR